MEIEKEFNLVFYHRESGKMYRVKRITRLDFILIDPEDYLETRVRLALSRHALDKAFYADKENGKRQKKVRLDFTKKIDH